MSDEPQTKEGGASRRGRGGFKDREDQSIGDPFWVSGAEFLSTALAHSCQAAVRSDTQRETVGLEGRDGGGEELQRCRDAHRPVVGVGGGNLQASPLCSSVTVSA